MNKTWLRWLIAILITLTSAVYQRLTGPTYPKKGKIKVENFEIKYRLTRSHGGGGDQPVEIQLPDTSFRAYLLYRRYKTQDDWTKVAMVAQGDKYRAALPHQPPAGKLEYVILLEYHGKQYSLPEKSVVTRFKGHVPRVVLIIHILLMFSAMLLSSYTALEAIAKGKHLKRYVLLTVVTLFLGGMILGPIVQKYAFGAYWTGIPFGYDLTDNKTLIALLGWLWALIAVRRFKTEKAKWWVVLAAVILLAVYSIPHSAMGSELDYKTMRVKTG